VTDTALLIGCSIPVDEQYINAENCFGFVDVSIALIKHLFQAHVVYRRRLMLHAPVISRESPTGWLLDRVRYWNSAMITAQNIADTFSLLRRSAP